MTDLAPSIYSLPHVPLPSNSHPTPTLTEQAETESLIERLLSITAPLDAPNGTTLRTAEHNKFLASTLFKLPAPYVALDASKPWLLFWTLQSLDILGIGVDQTIKDRQACSQAYLDSVLIDRAVSTLSHFMHPLGGFAGGPSNSQLPHLLPTYASTCTLAITGSEEPGGGWESLADNRQATYDFFMRCKRPDGGFVVCEGGEVDVRYVPLSRV
jgi:protein farnesyltransferase subunit beta